MKTKKLKFLGSLLTSSLIICSFTGIIDNNQNIAKAYEISKPLEPILEEDYSGWANNNGAITVLTMDYYQCKSYMRYYETGQVLDAIAKGFIASLLPVKSIAGKFGLSVMGAISTKNQSNIYRACQEAVRNKKNFVMVYVYFKTGNYGQYWFEYIPRIIYG